MAAAGAVINGNILKSVSIARLWRRLARRKRRGGMASIGSASVMAAYSCSNGVAAAAGSG